MKWICIPNFLIILKCTLLYSCLYDIPEDIEWNTDNYEPGVVISSSNHLGFPDLVFYNNVWYVSYRESDDHGSTSTRSSIRILKSIDFKKWEEINVYEMQDYDVREGFFSYDELTNNLYLHIHYCNFTGKLGDYGDIRNNVFIHFDNSTNKFEEQNDFKRILLPEGGTRDLLWMPLWHKGNMYATGYSKGNVRFYIFSDINKEAIIFSSFSENLSTETTLKFYNDQLYALMRRRSDVLFFTFSDVTKALTNNIEQTTIPFETTLLNIGELGGPNMVIKDSIAYIGGRSKDENGIPRTTIYKYSLKNKEIELYERLISYGDNSYPAMILQDDRIYGVYYTKKNDYRGGYQIRSFILNTDSIPIP